MIDNQRFIELLNDIQPDLKCHHSWKWSELCQWYICTICEKRFTLKDVQHFIETGSYW